MDSFGKQMATARSERETLDPADFELCCEYYVGPNEDIADAYSHEHLPADFDGDDSLGRCGHCGTNHFYGAVFRDKRDGSYLAVGCDCAENFFRFSSRREYFKAAAAREAATRERTAKARAEANAFLAARLDLQEAFQVDHPIIADIHDKLYRYGSISEKQAAFVIRLALEVLEAEPEVEPQPIPADVLDGRHEFAGVVLGFKTVENAYGVATKMVFADDRGFKLYGTAFSADKGYDKGDRVSFVARVERSKDDPCFGFYSRPTRGTVL